ASGPLRAAPVAFDATKLPNRYPTRVPWDTLGTAQRLPLLQRLDKDTRAADKRITKVKASLGSEHGAILIVDSEGRVFEDLIPMTTLYLTCTAEDGKGRRE